jgi:CBS domain containing-hemolysin-like protein
MTAEVWTPWVIVAASAIVHLVVTVALMAYSGWPGFMPAGGNGGNSHDAPPPQLDPRARVLAVGLQAASLLAAGLGLAAGLPDPLDAAALAIGGGAAIGGRVLIHAGASWFVHRYRPRTREALRPVVWSLTRLAGLPGTATLASLITGRTYEEAAGEQASAVLKESLDYLEEAQIPPGQEELRMIRGILRMDTVKVREIMRPRVDMVAAPVDAEPGAIAELMAVGGHSKIPVFKGSIDAIVGVVYARDLLRAIDSQESSDGLVSRLARPALFVPESQNLERLLREFQEHRTGIAIVFDEYGGVSGLVTVTDLIEEIVGELVDEFDVESPEIQMVSGHELVADGSLSIDALNQALGVQVQSSGVDTVGGLILRELGQIPRKGDSVRVGDLTLTVQSTLGRRVQSVRVVRQPAPVAPEGG